MDRNRLIAFIAISAAILLGFQVLFPGPATHRPAGSPPTGAPLVSKSAETTPNAPNPGLAAPGRDAPRVAIAAPKLQGSFSLKGARLDDLLLRGYHETTDKASPLVRLLAPGDDHTPASVQLGWSATDGTKVPGDDTIWTSSGGDITPGHPATLTWDNGAGQVFTIVLSVDDGYMFTAAQSVKNSGAKPVSLVPWQRARRDYAQPPATYSVVFEGLKGATETDHAYTTHEIAYPGVRKAAQQDSAGFAYNQAAQGGWAGFSDKYWLTALIPDQTQVETNLWYYGQAEGVDHYQVSYQAGAPVIVAPGATAQTTARIFAGAKESRLLEQYQDQQKIPLLSYAIDWGWYFFLTRPFLHAIDFLYRVTGNFGIAILLFTTFIKILFYPLASNSYRSMGKMRLLGPKIQAARERHKDDPAAQQAAMMEVYKQEGVNPAAQLGGCLPMLLQIPVFFSLYKVILINIQMRHAPFFGWVHDLSAIDPTNIFTLFGLIPFDPTALSPTLHLGIWPLLLGASMFFQQKLNPPPPDPVQARMFQFMPLVFMFMMGRFPAGLVIYWTWNNTLTIAQQWYIQSKATLGAGTPAKA